MSEKLTQIAIIDESILKELQSYRKSADFLEQIILLFEEHGINSKVELNQAIKLEDIKEIHRVIHRLKGSSLNVGAISMVELLRKMEQSLAKNLIEPEFLALLNQLPDLVAGTCKALRSIG